jgi:long-subunit acyl-CoA synthetase (AMP-forming)
VSDEEWSFAAPYLTFTNKDPLRRRYELREMFNVLCWIVRADVPFRLGSVGRIVSRCAIQTGEDGEIMIRSSYLFDAYYGNPDRTAEAFRDGWYLIGDVGSVDDGGYLFLGGRKTDVI